MVDFNLLLTLLISLMVEQDTSNIWIRVRFLDKNIKKLKN
jgi:hypothetical protein